ncbi:MBL fold metallo-hydrolase [Gemmatimonas phototrophica]|uniref:MBL fold metallo-hydrolase n=1 Tax=Gemmatimonas phototrophica TaxID=1379270 RepID=UPI0006A721D1|nr:MBL fold metallo-hydrolase [Gemmatimonas phototrophica]
MTHGGRADEGASDLVGGAVITVTMLGSGSRGNAILIDGSEGTVLVDAGFGVRTLAKRFETAQRAPDDVGAVLLTHEHVDHACGAAAACDRWSWPIHATSATLAALSVQASGSPMLTVPLAERGATTVCGFSVEHAPVPHDAADCRALVLTDVRSGARAGIVLDAGHVPDGLSDFLDRLDLLVLESNHDSALLTNGPYPWPLKQRISGGQGHLSNAEAAHLAAACAHRGLRGVVLAHLSETNNTPDLALGASRDALRKAGWKRDSVSAAPQRLPLSPVRTDGGVGRPAATQLALGL